MTAKFWVGGTGTWDNSTTTNWSLSSGGASGAAVPGTGDTVTFDASSGTGTCTVAATINGSNTISSLTCGAMTGPFILDFSVNNPNLTMAAFSPNGTGTRTIKMGSGTYTFTGGNTVVDFSVVTNLTFQCGTSTFAFTGNQGNRNFLVGTSQTFGTLSVATSATFAADLNISGTTPTFAAMTVTSPARLVLATSLTVSNAFTFAGTSATSPAIIEAATNTSSNPTITCTSGTCSFDWCIIIGITGAGGATFNATNSFGWNNSNITVTGPSGGGGGLQYRPNMSGNV